jgi:Flp pilus assembly pilin Flp
MFLRKLLRNKKGAALVEYGLLVAGVALVAAAAVAIFGTKTNDLIASIASVLPGAHDNDNGPIVSGKILETGPNADQTGLAIAIDDIDGNRNTPRLGNNLGVPVETLIIDPETE